MQSGLPTQWGVLNIMVIWHLSCDRTKHLSGPEDFAALIMIKMTKRPMGNTDVL